MVVNMLKGMKRVTDPEVVLLQAMADPTRLAILRQLAGGDAVCACDFTACCDVAQPTVSHHLRVLRDAGWVRTERRGSFIYYELESATLRRLQAIVGALAPATAPAGRVLPVVQPAAPN
jgi:ArsR family transcriptional regulator